MSQHPIAAYIAGLRLSLRQQITLLCVLAALLATAIVALLVVVNERKTSASVNNEVNTLTVSRVERSAVKSADVCGRPS